MKIFIVLASIILIYTILGSIIKRKLREKSISNVISINLNTYVSYSNFIYSLCIAALACYFLFDKSSKSLDIYSIILVMLIITLSLFKLLTQRLFNPILLEEGILFYNGDILLWDNVIEFHNTVNANGDFIVTIGGKINSLNVAREKIVVPKKVSVKFEHFISGKITIK